MPARTVLVSAAVLVLLAVSALPALAHVTVRADTSEPGGFAVYTVRVPNESETGTTTSVEVQMPEGFEASRYKPVPGYDIGIADGVLTIEAGDGNAGIAPGQFQEFQFQARNPEEPGDLVFPAVQTYDDGEVANWTGPEDADQPAPVVAISTAAAEEDDEAPDSDSDGDGDAGALAWIGIALGALGTLAGGVALFRRSA